MHSLSTELIVATNIFPIQISTIFTINCACMSSDTFAIGGIFIIVSVKYHCVCHTCTKRYYFYWYFYGNIKTRDGDVLSLKCFTVCTIWDRNFLRKGNNERFAIIRRMNKQIQKQQAFNSYESVFRKYEMVIVINREKKDVVVPNQTPTIFQLNDDTILHIHA